MIINAKFSLVLLSDVKSPDGSLAVYDKLAEMKSLSVLVKFDNDIFSLKF